MVLAIEKRIASSLLEPSSVEKIFEIDTHIGCAVSGLTADAKMLVEHARVETQVLLSFLHFYNSNILLFITSPCGLKVLPKEFVICLLDSVKMTIVKSPYSYPWYYWICRVDHLVLHCWLPGWTLQGLTCFSQIHLEHTASIMPRLWAQAPKWLKLNSRRHIKR